ncbi:transglycosylase [uncultured Brevundimonas sp.]|uniref:transglycosylase n=1 Tax=uncultured Brevundimonas sp. TaxID=213418 RepID=UPI00261431F2|nr:transglycosylase [uncultured Brevundimonas sp.]
MPYVELTVTVVAVSILALIADFLAGRRELPAFFVVAYTGAAAGAFLAVRVFAIATYDSWIWPIWAAVGAVAGLILYFLFRKKR